MGNWNDDLLKVIEAIASEAEQHSGEEHSDTADHVPVLDDLSFRSASSGVTICRMLFDPRGAPEDFLLESVNPAFCRLFRVAPEMAAGRRGSDFFFPDGKKIPALDLFNRVLKEGETVSFLIHSEKFDRVYDVLAFSPGGDVFCMVLGDASLQASAERERRENDRFTEKIFRSVDVWITLLDERGRVVFWNAAAERMSGISSEEALSGSFDFWSVFSPEEQYRGHIFKKMDTCRRGEVPEVRIETGISQADGASLRVDWTARPWHFEDIDAQGLLLLGRDVTEMRRMEGELRESERRYAAAFRESRAAMFLVDSESGTVFDCNDAALAFYGYSREEMIGMKNCSLNTRPAEELRRDMQEAKAGRKNRFIFNHRLKNGDIRTVEVYASPMPYSGTTYLFSIVHDITETQRLEEKLHSLSPDCSLQAKILGSILENSSDYLYVFDSEEKFRFVGKKGASLFGRDPREMTGLSWEQAGIPGERTARFIGDLRQVFSTGKAKYGIIILPGVRGDKPLTYALNAACNDDGTVAAVFCSMRAVP